MSAIRTRLIPLAVLLLALAAVPAMAAAPAPDAAPAATTASAACGPVLPDLDLAGSPLLDPLPQAVTPHCCSQQAIDACRSGCKDIAPGCKGEIGCRAGECVCTCNCP